jgi:hypothetical protein
MPGEERLDDRALDADPAPVDQAHLGEAVRAGGVQVLVDDGRDVAGRERVEVERILDRDADGLVGAQG